MYLKSFTTIFFYLLVSAIAQAQSAYKCTGPGLNELMKIDLSSLQGKELNPSFTRNSPQFSVFAYYLGSDLKVLTISYSGESDKEDIKAYFQSRDDYLMTYHKQQNSAFYFESDSVLLREEKSYFHVCDDRLLAPAVGGIIDSDLYDKTKLMVDTVIREEMAE